MNQKLTLLMHNTVIQDGVNDILIVFHIDRGWFRRNATRKKGGVVVMSTFKATGMDFGVDLVLVRQLESVVSGYAKIDYLDKNGFSSLSRYSLITLLSI